MGAISLSEIPPVLQDAEAPLIATHTGPDGDALGSALALFHMLLALGKKRVVFASEDPVPRTYQWLPGADRVVFPEEAQGPFDLAVVVDVSQLDRIGKVNSLLTADTRVLVIDHHLDSAPAGDLYCVDSSYAAVGEILFELFEHMDTPLTHEAAVCAYVAQITDTGSFRYSNTNARSHRIAARLVETGIDAAGIATRVFDRMSRAKFDLLKRVLDEIKFNHDGRLAHASLTLRDLEAAAAKDEDCDGLINYIRNVEGVEVAVLFRVLDSNTTKVSFRSQTEFNSAGLLEEFGGGGHVSAAGATVDMPLNEARTVILKRVRNLLAENR